VSNRLTEYANNIPDNADSLKASKGADGASVVVGTIVVVGAIVVDGTIVVVGSIVVDGNIVVGVVEVVLSAEEEDTTASPDDDFVSVGGIVVVDRLGCFFLEK
jgi:hypothetical protein